MGVIVEDGRLSHAVLVRLRPRQGQDHHVQDLLNAVLRLAQREQHTETSFLMRFEDGAYGLLDLFTCEPDRREHLAGAARQAIAYRSRDLLDIAATDVLLDVVGHQLPTVAGRERLASGTWLTFVGDVDDADLRVTAPEGSSWIAVRTDGGTLGVIDLSPAVGGSAPRSLPAVERGVAEARLLTSDHFDLVGPDVPDPTIVVPSPLVTS